MNIISIDYGKKYIGLSLGNSFFLKKIPLFIFKNYNHFLYILNYIFFIFFIEKLLIGFPVFFIINSISYLELIFSLKKFIIKIINIYNIKLKLINESYSSYKFKKSDHFSSLFFLKHFYTRR